MNLVSNAIKFTENGEIYIVVSKTSEKDDKVELLFSVRDTGVGIPPDRIHKLFRPFSQVDSSSTRRYGGAGLGLAICARAVNLLGGQIWVESQPVKGTSRNKLTEGSTFSFTISVAEHAGDPQDQNLCPLLANKKEKAIIIDDNTTCRQVVEDLLKEWGFAVQSAATTEQALDLVKNGERFDIVVAEQMLPDYSGVQLREIFRNKSPRSGASKKQDVAFVILASRTKRDQIVRGDDGALQVVLKPVRHRVLYEAIAALMKQSVTVPPSAVAVGVLQDKHPTLPPMNILVVEDNIINQKLIVRILKIMGEDVDVANNGLEALSAVRKKKYDIVLMDIQMPEMDGYEATIRIRNDIPIAKQPVIIAMTAHALQGDRQKCFEVGMDDYMSKPILIDEVKRISLKWYETIHNQVRESYATDRTHPK